MMQILDSLLKTFFSIKNSTSGLLVTIAVVYNLNPFPVSGELHCNQAFVPAGSELA